MLKLLFSILFLSPVLSHALELSESQTIKFYIEKNLEAAASKYEIDVAKAQELTAGLWANPSIFIDSQLNPFGKNWNQKNAGGPTQQDFILTVPVDLNGKRRQAVKVARLATKVSEAEFTAFVRDGIFNALTALYNLQRLQKEQELLEEKAQLLERLVLTLEKRIGSTSSQPLIQSRARLALEDVKLEIRKKSIEQVESSNNLKVLLHDETNEAIVPKATFLSSLSAKPTLQDLIDNAKKKRPDFVALSLLKEQLQGQQDLDERRIFSDVAFQAGASRQMAVGSRPGDATSPRLPGAWSWLIGVSIPIPVFDRNQGTIMQTKIRENQTLVRERFMLQTVSKDLDTSLNKIELTQLNLQNFKNGQLNNAKIVRDSALRQFGTGATTLIEYLDAVDAYHTSISKYITAQYELTTEVQKLKLLSGQEIGL